MEQADLVEGLWRHFFVGETGLVAHDIGGRLLKSCFSARSQGVSACACRASSSSMAPCTKVLPAQSRCSISWAQPIVGPVLGRLMTERLFTRNLAARSPTS